MRWFYVAIVSVFVLAIVIFAVQNLYVVTISFLGLSFRAPMAVVAVAVYVLGMGTGSSLLAMLKKSMREVQREPR